jgi:uncharacterized membrane protein
MNEIPLKFTLSPSNALNKAWNAVTSNMGPMVGFTILYGIVISVAGRIPFIGQVANLFQFVFAASLFSAFDAIDRYGKASFNDFFTWTPRFGKLLVAQLIYVVIALVLLIPLFIALFSLLGIDYLNEYSGSSFGTVFFRDASMATVISLIVLAFFEIILLLIFTFAFMFLVQFKDMPAIDALKLSFKIGKENPGQIVVFALLAIGVAILGLLALFIGLLIAIPVIVGMQYYLIRSIYPAAEKTQWDFMRNEPVA